ncbi:MAG: rifampin ADP-ribosyl transferase [Dictyoglomus sp.]
MTWNPFISIKEFLQEEVDLSLFPLRALVEQYSSLDEEKWKDLELTTSFLDVAVEILESKLRRLFDKKKEVKNNNKEEDLKLVVDDSWKDLVEYLREKEEKSLLIFRREKTNEVELVPEKKINITEIYVLFLEKRNKGFIDLNYLEEDFKIDFESKYKEVLRFQEGRFSDLVKGKCNIEVICYLLVLCDLSNKGKVILEQKEAFGEIYFKIRENERDKAYN